MLNKKRICIAAIAIFVVVVVTYLVIQIPEQKLSGFFAEKYLIRGIDVSHHQNEIDWEKIPGQGINFAYIKATEGSSWVDECLEENYNGAKDNGLDYGFYHFVSFESSPKDQLKNYKDATKEYEMTLIPALDAEFYGDMEQNPLPKDEVLTQINELEELFKEEYGCYPLLYTTQKFYYRYLRGEVDDYPTWIRNVYYLPTQEWTVWQCTDKLNVDGIETPVDGNVTDESRYKKILF